MYLLLHWMDVKYLILDTSTARLGDMAHDTVLEAVINFNDSTSWDISERTDRFTLTDTTLTDISKYHNYHHKIIASLSSLDLDYVQQHYPELLI